MPRHGTDPDHEDLSFVASFGAAAAQAEHEPKLKQHKEIAIPKRYQSLWQTFATLCLQTPDHANACKRVFLHLMDRYNEPHRRHHTLSHIEDLIEQFEFYKPLLGRDAPAVLAAIFFHDCVYECKPGSDEEESVTIARTCLRTMGFSLPLINRTITMIESTAKHVAPKGDFATQLFLDMDMSILAARRDRYSQYVENTRFEYCTKHRISEGVFNAARADRFLRPLLQSGQDIFKTEQFSYLNAVAKANIQWELEQMEKDLAPRPATAAPI